MGTMMWEQVGSLKEQRKKDERRKVKKVAAVLPVYYLVEPLKTANKLCV